MHSSKYLWAISVVALALAVPPGYAQDSGLVVTPSELQWKPGDVPGLESASVIGNMFKPGPYVAMVKFPANFTVRPHSHPEARQYTIISGTWYIGWGSTLDESKLKALPPGSFYTEPANVPHFVVTKGEPVIIQVSGTGPSASNFIAPGK
jgi:quercetin dioxygenase-like cupin family protein